MTAKAKRKSKNALRETCTVSVAIACPHDKVYAFLAAPKNFPQWASGFCSEIEKKDGKWIARTPVGKRRVEFRVAAHCSAL